MNFDKISVTSVREEFVRAIENKILSGELRIGDRLPSARELCTMMGVSLTSVSTGITELANKGFLEVKPRHGVYVKDYRKDATPETFFAILRYNGGNLNIVLPNDVFTQNYRADTRQGVSVEYLRTPVTA